MAEWRVVKNGQEKILYFAYISWRRATMTKIKYNEAVSHSWINLLLITLLAALLTAQTCTTRLIWISFFPFHITFRALTTNFFYFHFTFLCRALNNLRQDIIFLYACRRWNRPCNQNEQQKHFYLMLLFFFSLLALEIKSACDYGNLVNAIWKEKCLYRAKPPENEIELQFRVRILWWHVGEYIILWL